jgi:hypothetical protein
MPLTREQTKYLTFSAFHTIDAVASILEELTEAHSVSENQPVLATPYA